jgi:hypothetical protein
MFLTRPAAYPIQPRSAQMLSSEFQGAHHGRSTEQKITI